MSETNKKNDTKNGLQIREAAVRALMAITLKKRPFDAALETITDTANLNARDRAFVLNLLMLCLRRYGNLKALLASLLERGLPRNATWTEAALITGLAQILLMRTADHAAVNETVTLIKNLPGKESGFAGLVNAILRRACREQDKLTQKLNATPGKDLPGWLFDNWTAGYGEKTAIAIAATLQHTPSLDISLRTDADAEEWAAKLDATILPTGTLRRAVGDVTALEGYGEGVWWVQDFSAAIPATLFGDIEGKDVLDLCAAPGGKTMQLATRGAQVTSVDRSAQRLQRLSENLVRTKLNAEVIVGDAAKFAPIQKIDHILLDAPCSATGTLRRNPDVTWTKTQADVEKLANLQARLLDHAFFLLPRGGTLVYCVCSLETQEGIDQIRSFLSHVANAARKPITAEEVGGLSSLITEDGDLLCLPSDPSVAGGMDGFYAARLVKN